MRLAVRASEGVDMLSACCRCGEMWRRPVGRGAIFNCLGGGSRPESGLVRAARLHVLSAACWKALALLVELKYGLAKADAHPVPAIDGGDRQRPVGDLLGVEMVGHRVVCALARAGGAELSQRLGPGQRGPLRRGEQDTVAPKRHGAEPTEGLAAASGFGALHVDAERAAIDLRGAQFDQL